MGSFELGTDGPGAILVGVDGSPTSMRAAAYAAGLARRQRTRLIAVWARSAPTTLITLADHSGMAMKAVLEAQEETERQLRAEIGAWGAHTELIVRQGDPLTVLAEVAKETRADAVIVGSSASVGHRIAGSLAVRLVRYGRWPVTVVP
ncbi:universal stress protein [Paractinoplanes globisporus]|uniref:Universal stress protein n=1 Tax=Paractinoplanes globisporus TaxID=113565 RepID=A0ABW6WSM7_9ACTN|nr:universal stress protein [Actinoplanes globisporus]